MTAVKIKWIRFAPSIFMMGLIFFISNQPGDSLHLPSFPFIDKAGHVGIYTLLGFAYIFAADELRVRLSRKSFNVLIIMLCVFYGITDEFHQYFVPQRSPSLADIIADGFGGLCAVLLWRRRRQK